MGAYTAEMRAVSDGLGALDPTALVLNHHRAGTVAIGVELLTGGHLLHLAVAGCFFNNIFRIASERGIVLQDCQMTVDGGFNDAGTRSTGIECHVEIAGSIPAGELEALVRQASAESTISSVMRAMTDVKLDVVVAGSSA